jgi:hypothetical protein
VTVPPTTVWFHLASLGGMTELPRYIGRHASPKAAAPSSDDPPPESTAASGEPAMPRLDFDPSAAEEPTTIIDPSQMPSEPAAPDPPASPEESSGGRAPTPIERWAGPRSANPPPGPEPPPPMPPGVPTRSARDEPSSDPSQGQPWWSAPAPDVPSGSSAPPEAPESPEPAEPPESAAAPEEAAPPEDPMPDAVGEPEAAADAEDTTDLEPDPEPVSVVEAEPEALTEPEALIPPEPSPEREPPAEPEPEPVGPASYLPEPEPEPAYEPTTAYESAPAYEPYEPTPDPSPTLVAMSPTPRSNPPTAGQAAESDSHGLARLALLDAIDEVWPGGTADLSTWLAANLDLLDDPLGFSLTQRHHTPSADLRFPDAAESEPSPLDIPGNLLTADLSGASVMLRAQSGRADTEGLGALLSAAAATRAQTAVWVCPQIDANLRQALRWIGGDPSANVRLYGLEMYLVQIAGSPTAPLFDAVVTPGTS